MRKSTIFISVLLTTFALVMLYGVVDAYRSISDVPPIPPAATNTTLPEPTIEPTVRPMLTPEEAAQLAAAVVGQTNLLSAESSVFNDVQAYKITFTNNDVVYVGLDGQILSVEVAPVVVNVVQPAQARHRDDDAGSGGGGGGGGDDHSSEDHEDHDEPESHDD